jgi:hypothetical protein
MRDASLDELHPLFQREQRMLAFILCDSDDYPVKEFCRALNDIQMTVGERIETAWINYDSHGRQCSQPIMPDEDENQRRLALVVSSHSKTRQVEGRTKQKLSAGFLVERTR